MNRHLFPAALIVALSACAPAARAQFAHGLRGGFATRPVMSATVAPQSAPGSIFPGPGPTTRPPAVFFSPFRRSVQPFRPFGFYGGFGPYYGGYPFYSSYYYDYDAPSVYAPAPPEPPEPIYQPIRPLDNPLQAFPALDSSTPTRARLKLTVPESAEVWLNGKQLESKRTTQVLESPDLDEGASFTFDLRVRWMEGNEPVEVKRKLSVGVGESQTLTYVAAPAHPRRASK